MKIIIASIKPFQLEEVRNALNAIGLPGMTATEVKDKDAEVVHFGCTVGIVRDDGSQQSYRIVGEDEADPNRGTVSYVSPVAGSKSAMWRAWEGTKRKSLRSNLMSEGH
jgi:hypothetical protein